MPEAVASTATAPRRSDAAGSWWRDAYGLRTWRAVGFAILGFPLGIAGFVYVAVSSFVSVPLFITFFGIPLLALSLTIDRWLGWAHRMLGASLLDAEIPEPRNRAHGPEIGRASCRERV